jgi:hypothetical protein
LIERAKLLKKKTINKELGLSDEELAFYDILSQKDIIKEAGPVQDIVHE